MIFFYELVSMAKATQLTDLNTRINKLLHFRNEENICIISQSTPSYFYVRCYSTDRTSRYLIPAVLHHYTGCIVILGDYQWLSTHGS